jgi:hypothetical protein
VVNPSSHSSTSAVVEKEKIDHWPEVIFASTQISFLRRTVHVLGVPLYTTFTFVLLYYSVYYRIICLILSVLFAASPLFNGFDSIELMITNNEKLSKETNKCHLVGM